MIRYRIYFTFCWDYKNLVGDCDILSIRMRFSNDWLPNTYQFPIIGEKLHLMEKPINHVGRYETPRQRHKPSRAIEDHD